MKFQYGIYELEFDDKVAELFKKHVYDTIEDSAPIYISSKTNEENAIENCKTHSKDELYHLVMESVVEDLRLCGVSING